MSWVIVGLVAAILVSSLFKLLPRGRILHIQRLREAARKLGYRVENPDPRRPDPALLHCVGYRQSLERCPLPAEFSCQREGQDWLWLLGSAEASGAQAVLDALPDQVRRIDRQSFSVLVYWVEPDSVAALHQLDVALAPLRTA
ncbi:MAG: hypothetical protein CVV16_00640 [Gammaproteobacteria bacterium HGW-Gammaproteobacteria-6]|nr:MAG: hypothetical protein CVV16_00640 [Gammaproteobacteria bacterium HGW-Gammaproteobacteria-6]